LTSKLKPLDRQNARHIEGGVENRNGSGLRELLLAAECICVGIIYWQGLPIYRVLIANQEDHVPQREGFAWVVGASVLIQVAYWTRYRTPHTSITKEKPLAGHLFLFAARLLFLFAGAVFSYLFIAKQLENQLPVLRYVGILFALFSVFCFTRELELLGKRLMGRRS
jgi:hypothetical protein